MAIDAAAGGMLEVWDIGKPMARQVLPAPTGQALLPDMPNWSWHEYGMRVGFWRFHKLFGHLGVRPTLSINARVCDDYERVAAAARDAGWEFMGHAWEQGPIHKEADQRCVIHRSMDRLQAFTGRRPRGWPGPLARVNAPRRCPLRAAQASASSRLRSASSICASSFGKSTGFGW